MDKNMKACEKCIYRNEKSKAYCGYCTMKSGDDIESLLDDLLGLLGGLNLNFDGNEDEGEYEAPENERPEYEEETADPGLGRVSDSWLRAWKRAATDSAFRQRGIILTNTEKCREEQRSQYTALVNKYIAYKAERGVKYCLLDLSDASVVTRPADIPSNDPEFIVNLLRQIYNTAPIEYLMIIGDRKVVGSVKWKNGLYNENGYGDSDEYVDSDVPYVFLETRSLFDGKPAKRSIRVGRVPASGEWGFITAKAYLNNVMSLHKERRELNSVTLSAEEWGNTTRTAFSGLSPHSYECPPYSFVEGAGRYRISNEYPFDLMCFNLHGSAVHNGWVSGNGTAGINPKFLPTDPDRLYVIGTEACYGAKPVIRRTTEQSMLITALRNRCIGFLGSTQIAYGITDRMLAMGSKPMCADVMVGKFADLVHKGYPLGDAYIEAWSAVSTSCNVPDLENVKTLCSFALYGDPTATFASGREMKASAKGMVSRLHKPAVDMSMKMEKVSADSFALKAVNNFVLNNFPECYGTGATVYKADISAVSGSIPALYKSDKAPEYKATYAKTNNNITNILHVYFNDKGEVTRVYASK